MGASGSWLRLWLEAAATGHGGKVPERRGEGGWHLRARGQGLRRPLWASAEDPIRG